jgi:hypothetical protein
MYIGKTGYLIIEKRFSRVIMASNCHESFCGMSGKLSSPCAHQFKKFRVISEITRLQKRQDMTGFDASDYPARFIKYYAS